MSTDVGTAGSAEAAELSTIDMALEVMQIPVADVDRAKDFYLGLGWRFDIDLNAGDVRVVQITPPHSPCSIQLGSRTHAQPGSAQGTILVVGDIDAARDDLVSRGVAVSDVEVMPPPPGVDVPESERSYRATASFADPDGNTWILQEINNRLPGRTWEA